MFNDRYGLTQAVLSGRKTQTRRICKEQVWAFSDIVNAENGIFHFEILRYKVGEVVAIAQSYKDAGYSPCDFYNISVTSDGDRNELAPERAGWVNKLFVSANLMPHHIRITDVKVGRLQDISDEDCFKEGIRDYSTLNEKRFGFSDFQRETIVAFKTPREAYIALIDRISGKGTWESNPYVFTYEFELVD